MTYAANQCANCAPIVSINHLSVAYTGTHAAKYALQNVCLNVDRGSWVSIVGANGSGKSTLAKVIAGLYRPTEGRVEFNAEDSVYIVLQNPETQILGNTLYEELLLSLKDSPPDNREIGFRFILEEVGLLLPLDTPTDQLSGGEKQLLNIASSVAAGATLFVLDEATSMLDPASRQQVIHAMQRLHDRGATIIWVTHRPEELGYADRVLLLEEGRVAFDGPSRRFFYGNSDEAVSPCERWNMELPYVVQVALTLKRKGYSLPDLPLLPHELAEAIEQSCPFK